MSFSSVLTGFYFVLRWFGLDTIFCVVAIQLFLSRFNDQLNMPSLIGLCCIVSAVYIVDRNRDLMLGIGDTKRHQVYHDRIGWVFGSVFCLGIGGLAYWLSLDGLAKLILLFCFVVVVFHFWLLKFNWYHWIKSLLVAFLFTVVMMVGHLHLVWMVLLIASFCLYNLKMHDLVERKWGLFDFARFITLAIAVLILAWFNVGFSWLFLVWFVSVGGHLLLVVLGSKFNYWFELGDCLFAIPFVVGYLL